MLSFSVFHARVTFRGAGSAVSALTLATGLGGCLDFRKVPWQLADEYECFGTCVICTEVDVIRLVVTDNEQSVSMPPAFNAITVNANPICP